MNNLKFGLVILAIGMTVVMTALIVLCLFTHSMAKILNPKSFEALKSSTGNQRENSDTSAAVNNNYNTELVAIITAAIASQIDKKPDQIKLISIEKTSPGN